MKNLIGCWMKIIMEVEKMKEQTFLQGILLKILKKLGLVKEFEVDKADMCKRAVDSGVCPNSCEVCAWNIGRKL